jgi:glycine oxidase
VIGGGVIGLSCAWRLAQAGARVGFIERGKVGREASWAAGGMLAAQCEMAHYPPAATHDPARAAMFDLCLRSRALYADFAEELFDLTGIDIELSLSTHTRGDWRTPGIMYVQSGRSEAELSTLDAQRAVGLAVEESAFHGRTARWLPGEGQVENRRLVQALHAACELSGVTVREDCRVDNVAQDADALVRTTHGDFPCRNVLLCAGAWSGTMGKASAVSTRSGPVPNSLPPTFPVAGHMLSLRRKSHYRTRFIAAVFI